MSFSGSRDSRRSSSARRRQARATRIFLLVGSLFALASFFGGYAWQAQKSKLRTTTSVERAPADPTARAEALDHIDEAIRAKHGKRTAGALSALERARSADPSVPGVDIAFAEIALEQGEFTQMRAAAAAAPQRDDSATAAAELLLGIDGWINRGSGAQGLSTAADAALARFKASSSADPFLAHTRFFAADVLRAAGREREGGVNAAAALQRLLPWDSSDVLSAKLIFASAEAGESGLSSLGFLPESTWTRTLSGLANPRASTGASMAQLEPFAARLTLRAMSKDHLLAKSAQEPHFTPSKPVSVEPVLP